LAGSLHSRTPFELLCDSFIAAAVPAAWQCLPRDPPRLIPLGEMALSVLQRKIWPVDSVEHHLQVRLGRRPLALRHFLDDAPATQRSTYVSGEVLVSLFQLGGTKHPFVFPNMGTYALADLRFCLAF
jgi:hypothetical protein